MVQALEPAGRRAAGRVPPHNLEAEESLLGAMLLSRDAISAAAEANVDTADFYKPAHAHIFDAILALYGQGEPVDPVTVADELRRAELLDNLGGRQALLRLQAQTPASANASHYAKIVNELALLRRLIAVAGDISEMGYDDSGEVQDTLDRAESLVFEVAERRVTDSLTIVGNALQDTLDELEARYGTEGGIVGAPTGYLDLDEKLMGLQPSTLVVLAARPAMGKALALPTPIPTPTGWTTMAELQPGDHVLDGDGNPTLVTYASPVFLGRRCFEVAFDDGSTVIADAEHQWRAYDNSAWRALRGSGIQRPRVVTTAQMIEEGVRLHDRPNWYLPLVAVDLPEAELAVDPYVLGCWLGDGASHELSPTAEELREVGLLRGARKHIPALYLRASFKQRLALLQGLMDTDGCVTNGNGTVELCLANRELLEQAHELVCSVGHKPGPIRRKEIALGDGRTALAWRFCWSPLDDVFRLPRKSARLAETISPRRHGRHTRRAITSIRPVPTEPVKCIAVASANHVYLAGRTMVPTHNTSLALGLAKGVAANARRPVMFFSMEMGTLELTKRLLATEARVKASKLWTANLDEAEWSRISHAVGRLAELPLLIDDNPHCTVMEMRAKARRAKARYGDLGLVVVDYIQLMTPSSPGGRRSENRQVEVAEISRGLKILARELECPVVALSQLNRQLEYRQDKRPMLADLRESGCMPASTRLLRADTGREITLGELVLSQEQPLVWSIDDQWRLVPRRLTRAFPSGVKPVFRLRLRSGYEVDASANHPFRTVGGWRRLDELAAGTAIAVPRRVPEPVAARSSWSDDELVLLAHLLGDGSMGPSSVKYATADPANRDAVGDAAHRLFGIELRTKLTGRTWQCWLPSPYRLTHGRRHPVRGWLEPLGLWGARSHSKFVPEAVFEHRNDQIALFLRHLWATDGSITLSRNARGRTARVYYATTSRRLADDVRRLLLRLDIRTVVSRARKAGYRDSWHVRVQGKPNVERFLREVGCHGARGEIIEEALATLAPQVPNPNTDLVPWAVSQRVKQAAAAAGVTHRALADALGERYCGSYLLGTEARPRRFSRDRLRRIGEIVGDAELVALGSSDVYWDEIVEIVPLGEQPTFDATIDDTHNFVANGVVAHNSLEQDADVVMFIYREEVYSGIDTPDADKGKAEVIVAKHRNGPTGTVDLTFIPDRAEFANMARG